MSIRMNDLIDEDEKNIDLFMRAPTPSDTNSLGINENCNEQRKCTKQIDVNQTIYQNEPRHFENPIKEAYHKVKDKVRSKKKNRESLEPTGEDDSRSVSSRASSTHTEEAIPQAKEAYEWEKKQRVAFEANTVLFSRDRSAPLIETPTTPRRATVGADPRPDNLNFVVQQTVENVRRKQINKPTTQNYVEFGLQIKDLWDLLSIDGRYRLISAGVISTLTFILPYFVAGFIWGLYICLCLFFSIFVGRPQKLDDILSVETKNDFDIVRDETELVRIEESIVNKRLSGMVFKGWMNELRGRPYEPRRYHINMCKSVLLRLHGSTLRVAQPARNVLLHTRHDDPLLSMARREPIIMQQRIYDLYGGKVCLQPRLLARRRWWSRKYPICIKLPASAELLDSTNEVKQNEAIQPRLRRPSSKQSCDGIEMCESYNGINVQNQQNNEMLRHSTYSDQTDFQCNILPKIKTTHSTPDITGAGFFIPIQTEFDEAKEPKDRKGIINLYFFARSQREKEAWFHKFRQAATGHLTAVNSQLRPHLVKPDKSNEDKLCSILRPRALSCLSELHSDLPSPSNGRPSLVSAVERGEESLLYAHSHLQFIKQILDLVSSDKICVSTTQYDVKEPLINAIYIPMDLGRCAMTRGSFLTTPSSSKLKTEADKKEKEPKRSLSAASFVEGSEFVCTMNLLATRIFYDLCRDKNWLDLIKHKVQLKLSTIRLPYYIDKLVLTRLDPGRTPPRIKNVHHPYVDDWGIWVDLDITFQGNIRLAIETKIDLMKLKKTGANTTFNDSESTIEQQGTSPIEDNRPDFYWSNTELPESPEDSADEDDRTLERLKKKVDLKLPKQDKIKERRKSITDSARTRAFRAIDKIAQHRYVQQVTDFSPVKKMLESVSTTPISLVVEATRLDGTLTINLPPPPSDRLWYSFRWPPMLELKATPRFGDRAVDLTTVSRFIESHLKLLLEKNLVVPNMDDLEVPFMQGNPMLHRDYNT